MSAEKKPKPEGEPSKAQKFLENAWSKYDELLVHADKMAEMTNTPAWRGMYSNSMRENRKLIASTVAAAKGLLDDITHSENTEELEKLVADAVKVIKEERIRHHAWFARSIYPVSKMEQDCNHIIENATREARDRASNNPLHDGDLAHEVAALLKHWPKVKWDEETGVLSVKH